MTITRLAILPAFTGVAPGFYSFISPVAYYSLRDHHFSCRYFCDGMLAAWLFSLVLRCPIARTSFDYGSIAEPYLKECERRGMHVLVMGGTPAEAQAFGRHLMTTYPALRQQCLDGYPAGGFSEPTIDALSARLEGVDVLLLALGSPLQEQVGQQLINRGFKGTIITAGAFVTQTVAADSGRFYPRWINALNLRFLWRLIHEPHTRRRFKYVLSFPVSFAIDRLRGRVQVLRAPT